MIPSDTVVWHDLECGGYRSDMKLWLDLARDAGDPILDIGAGTGRVTLELAKAGHQVTAMDLDSELLAVLRQRAEGLPVSVLEADAREFQLAERFPLVIVPMQTVQLLGGPQARAGFLAAAKRQLLAGGVLAIALAPEFQEFTVSPGDPLPLPDMVELEGTVFASHPTAVRGDGPRVWLERLRERVSPEGERELSENHIALDRLSPRELTAEAQRAGLRAVGTHTVPETAEHIGSLVVVFRG
ncbi:MAG: class I SAM-dependent methyltransferase [Solirubrobacterales bacterium]|nr:class I SAM-dependent methyltransferase [Solirubrobacterales bacterium]